MLKPPAEPSIHVPYNLLTYLAKVAPRGSEREFILEKLRAYGYLKNGVSEDLEKRMEYAFHWVEDFGEIKEAAVKLSPGEAAALREFIQTLEKEEKEEEIQGAIFSIARKNHIPPKTFFKLLYTILLGAPEGPRLGPYILTMGRQNVIEALKRSLRKG